MGDGGSYQALKEQLRLARVNLQAGDLPAALRAVESALEIDPGCVAAVALRDQINTAHPQDRSEPIHQEPVLAPAIVSAEGWARFERRALARRVEHRADAARAAITDRRLTDARAALAEIRGLDPNYKELLPLELELDLATAARPRRTVFGPWVTAAAVFAAILLSATWIARVEVSSPQVAATTPRVDPPTVKPEPTATSGIDQRGRVDSDERHDQSMPPVFDVVPERADPRDGDGTVLRILSPEAVPEVASIAPIPAAMVLASPPTTASLPVVPTHPLSVPAPALSAPTPALSIPTPVTDEEDLVRQALQKFRAAYSGLDARMAQSVWPTVDEPALMRAFRGLESQELRFTDCRVDVRGLTAAATCHGSAVYVPKVGNREPRVESRVWNFGLRKGWEGWRIETARAE